MITLAFGLVAYLIGSLSFAALVTRLLHQPDPRTFGSGEPSATNLIQSGRLLAGLLTLLGDLLKGVAAVGLAHVAMPHLPKLRYFSSEPFIELGCAAALGVLLGHIFPLYRRLRGSNGVAVAIGAFFALQFMVGGAMLAIWAAVLSATRTVGLAGIAAALATPLVSRFYSDSDLHTATAVIFMVLLIWQHRRNIARLIRGTEPKIGRRLGK